MVLREARVLKFYKDTLGKTNDLYQDDILADGKVYRADVDFLCYVLFKIFKIELGVYTDQQNTGFVFIRPAYEYDTAPVTSVSYKDLVQVRFALQRIDELDKYYQNFLFDSNRYYTTKNGVEHIYGSLLINWCIAALMLGDIANIK